MQANCTPSGNLVRCCHTYLRRCTAIFIAITFTLTAAAQCFSPSMVFADPTLISGRSGRVGAIYKFSNVTTGVDATIEIINLVGGAGLNQMDNTTQGYYNAWQPYVTAGASDTSYLDWKITFKKAGTLKDTMLTCLSITAVDIDGDGSKLKEFIKASTPGAYAVDPYTTLQVSFDGVNSQAVGGVATVASIDTAAKKYMFQMNFKYVSTILYRNGSISTKTTTDVRHTCIYFKPFFQNGLVMLQDQQRANNPRNNRQIVVTTPGIVSRTVPVTLTTPVADTYRFSIYQVQGHELTRQSHTARPGANRIQLQLPGSTPAGIYILMITSQQGTVVYQKRLLVQ